MTTTTTSLGRGLTNRPETSPQRTFSNLSRHYLQLCPVAGLTGATLVTAKCQVLNQVPVTVEISLVPLWSLMRFLSLRLKPKAAARPRIGSGPGTDDVAGAELGMGAEKLLIVAVASPLVLNHHYRRENQKYLRQLR